MGPIAADPDRTLSPKVIGQFLVGVASSVALGLIAGDIDFTWAAISATVLGSVTAIIKRDPLRKG